jgi:hypothetical protein
LRQTGVYDVLMSPHVCAGVLTHMPNIDDTELLPASLPASVESETAAITLVGECGGEDRDAVVCRQAATETRVDDKQELEKLQELQQLFAVVIDVPNDSAQVGFGGQGEVRFAVTRLPILHPQPSTLNPQPSTVTTPSLTAPSRLACSQDLARSLNHSKETVNKAAAAQEELLNASVEKWNGGLDLGNVWSSDLSPGWQPNRGWAGRRRRKRELGGNGHVNGDDDVGGETQRHENGNVSKRMTSASVGESVRSKIVEMYSDHLGNVDQGFQQVQFPTPLKGD